MAGLLWYRSYMDSLANTSGYYPDIHAGHADRVTELTLEAPYLVRETPAGYNQLELMELVGGTIAWNQLANTTSYTNNQTDSRTYISLRIQSRASGSVFQLLPNVTTTGLYEVVFSSSITTSTGFYLKHSGSQRDLIFVNNTTNDIISGHKYRLLLMVDSLDLTTVGGLVISVIALTDLTQMLNPTIADYVYTLEQSTAGSGVQWLKSYSFFKDDYIAYSAPTLQSVEATAHVTVGFNQWDEEWVNGFINASGVYTARNDIVGSKNAIRVMPNTEYYFRAPVTGMFVTYWTGAVSGTAPDATKLISRYQVPNTKVFTTPSGCNYIHFNLPAAYGSSYNDDVCINISNAEKNGTYEAHWSETNALDSSVTLRGIPMKDADGNLYYDGDTYEWDGTVNRRFAEVDLGSLTWSRLAVSDHYVFWATVADKALNFNFILAPYVNAQTVRDSLADKQAGTYNNTNGMNRITIRDDSYTDAAAFKTAMSGKYCTYELIESAQTTESAEPFTAVQTVEEGGTEEFVTSNNVPVGNVSVYRRA